jgi:hypothetical protein
MNAERTFVRYDDLCAGVEQPSDEDLPTLSVITLKRSMERYHRFDEEVVIVLREKVMPYLCGPDCETHQGLNGRARAGAAYFPIA